MRQIVLVFMLFNFSFVKAATDQSALYKQKQKKSNLMKELTGEDPSKKSEKDLYVEILKSYQDSKPAITHSLRQQMEKKFSLSPLLDNSLYLEGLAYYQKKEFGKSLLAFDRIIKKYPGSNKVPAAHLAKGQIYKALDMNGFAKNHFSILTKKYPQSPEAFQAREEMRLIK